MAYMICKCGGSRKANEELCDKCKAKEAKQSKQAKETKQSKDSNK